ncbi:hypothetical protein MNBD_GAMMA08-418 [hydrothermal vent metagenome]|uniref:Thioredoxin-like fold domain-containing protein n=1 Tax=hydrothermal vent metagenome TaxID=652676 RepID=A0A3B0XIZ4_9ZZZZ
MSIKVELFSSPYCTKCKQAKKTLRDLVEEIGGEKIQYREVNIVEELDYAVKLGILCAPSIVINKELVFSTLPNIKKLRAELMARLKK